MSEHARFTDADGVAALGICESLLLALTDLKIISEENAEWVPHLVSFTDEMESDCPDSEVVGHARSARRQAVASFNTKFGDRSSYIFNGF